MAHFPKPFFRTARNSWFVQIGPRQINLGTDRVAAFARYHELMARPEATPVPATEAAKLVVVIVDELHAFANDDRGWHLRAVLSRLDRYTPTPLQRIGLSATVGNPAALLDWFAPAGARQVVGSSAVSTDAEVMIDHVGSLENAATVIERLHRGEKRLVFCDSRGNAERLGNALNQLGVRTFVSHASLSVSERRQAEDAFATERNCKLDA